MNVISILALLATIAATVLAYIFIIPEKKRASLNQLGKFVHDLLNFKFLIIERIVQFLYVLLTAAVICLGFFLLFYVESYWGNTRWYGGYGLLLMILGPVAIRVSYELVMMGILLVKNVIQINNKLKNQNEGKDKGADPFSDDVAKDYEFTLPKKEKKERVVYSAPAYYAPPQPQPAPAPQPASEPVWQQPAPQPEPEPVWQPAPEPQPVVRNYFCSECGSRLDDAGVCPNCGK